MYFEAIGVIIAGFVALGGFVVWRDNKVKKDTKQELALSSLSSDVKEIRDDVKGFKHTVDNIKNEVSQLCGKVDTVEKTANKAHSRIDEIMKKGVE